jgi:endo-1,4-beta-D-glucanase Y
MWLQVFRAGEKILDRQRFQFPPTWVYVDNVEGEWGAFNEIMKRKDAAVQAQVGSLQMKIVQEDKVVEQKTTELLQEWEKGKPVQVRTDSVRAKSVSTPPYVSFVLSLQTAIVRYVHL